MPRLVVGAIIGLCFLATALKSAVAAVPILNEGELKLDGAAYEGPGYFKTVITDASGTSVWSNDGSSVAGSEPTASVLVSIRSGSFSFVLGDPTVTGMHPLATELFRSEPLFLKTWWSANPAGPFQVIQTARFGGAPWAIGSEWTREVVGSALRTFPSGRVGINVSIEPNNALHVRGDALFEQQLRNGPSGSTLEIRHLKQVTEPGTFFNIGTYSRPTIEIAPGVSDLGFSIAGRFHGLRDQDQDAGSLADLRGVDIAYGHYSNLKPSAHTDTAVGLLLRPYHGIGTIGNSYALRIEPPWRGETSQATVDGSWGIYQSGDQLKNYFEGRLGLGTGTPETRLHVVGSATADAFRLPGGSAFTTNQTGALELGNSSAVGTMPHIDFHFGVGADPAALPDFNVRLANASNSVLRLEGSTSGALFEVDGLVRSMRGGFAFPDGTVQTSAASSGGNQATDRVGIFAFARGFPGPYSYESFGLPPEAIGWNLRIRSPNTIAFHPGDSEQGTAFVFPNGDFVANGDITGKNLVVNGGGPEFGAYITSPERIHIQTGVGNALHLNPFGGDVAVNALQPGSLFINDSLRLPSGAGFHSDQGGSLELGGLDDKSDATNTTRIPYIDFHFGGTSADFNTRIINNQSGRLSLVAAAGPIRLDLHGDLEVRGSGPTSQGLITAPNRLIIQADENLYLNPFQSTDPAKDHRVIVGGGNTTTDLEVSGTTSTKVLRITGGADLAERYTARPGLESTILPGMVVSYSTDGSQQILPSNTAYDRKVAGVVSGAGAIQAGISMGQDSTPADGEFHVAMLGRVQVWADASHGAIEVGDMLTTSATPGHAMKAEGSAQAMGSIIGKAISPLPAGKALVWMHVLSR